MVTFEMIGGRTCLDFANTWGDRRRPASDRLHGYADLLAFARQAAILPALTLDAFRARIRRHPGELKPLLRNPRFVAGIGNAYSDEILWEAGLRHDRMSSQLSTQEIRRLYRAMQEVIAAGMKAAGSPLDESEVEAAIDEDGEAADHLMVYGREGLACARCRQPIVRTRIKKGVFTYHCEQCMI